MLFHVNFRINLSKSTKRYRRDFYRNYVKSKMNWGLDGEESACSVGDPGSILGLGRSPGEMNGSSVYGILQVRILEWVAISFSSYHLNHDMILFKII